MMRWRPAGSSIVKSSLAAHAWLGLLVGAIMYLICLSGTFAVYYQELERWEQPEVHETGSVDPAIVQRAVENALARVTPAPPHLYVGLPTPEAPRLTVSTEDEHQAWFVNADGTLGDLIAHDWTHLLLNLHIYLHLPSTLGLLVVGASGALLVSLVISGFLSHPRIFKDAFFLRRGGTLHTEQVDLHNRLSVWASPFHLVIALTGAYFGLAGVVFMLLGMAFHDGNTEAASEAIYGTEPELNSPARVPDVAAALRRLPEVTPAGTSPSFLEIDGPGTPKQFLSFDVVLPGRLIWAESYRFDAAGAFLGHAGFSDGPIGRQIVYSSYRVHFGSFGGWPVKVLYGLLGLSLTIISATGINIWLARRRTRDYVNDLWMGTIWGAPLALALTAITAVLFDVPSTPLFWGALAASMGWALVVKEPARARRHLCAVTVCLLVVFLAGYHVKFDVTRLTPIAWWINAGIAAIAAILARVAASPLKSTPAPAPAAQADAVA